MTEATSIMGAVNPIEVLETGFQHSRIEHGGLETDQTERLVALGNINSRPRGTLSMWRSINQALRRRQKEIPETDLQRTGERPAVRRRRDVLDGLSSHVSLEQFR